MKKKWWKMPKVFEITEQPVPLHGWKPEHGGDYLRVLEQELRELKRQLADNEAAATNQKLGHGKQTHDTLLAVLQAMDAFERIFRAVNQKQDRITPQMRIWIGNFRTACRLLHAALTERGVTEMANLDQGFDPQWHQVAAKVFDPKQAEGTILDQEEKGYFWHDQVLRKAKVVVVTHDEEDAETSFIVAAAAGERALPSQTEEDRHG